MSPFFNPVSTKELAAGLPACTGFGSVANDWRKTRYEVAPSTAAQVSETLALAAVATRFAGAAGALGADGELLPPQAETSRQTTRSDLIMRGKLHQARLRINRLMLFAGLS